MLYRISSYDTSFSLTAQTSTSPRVTSQKTALSSSSDCSAGVIVRRSRTSGADVTRSSYKGQPSGDSVSTPRDAGVIRPVEFFAWFAIGVGDVLGGAGTFESSRESSSEHPTASAVRTETITSTANRVRNSAFIDVRPSLPR